MRTRIILTAVLALAAAGCTKFGQVNQGRVVRYEKEKGLITLVSDSNYMEPGKPRFDVLPAVTIRVPDDPKEMGPAPAAGKLLRLDAAGGQVTVFDEAAQALKTIPCKLVEHHEKVSREDARVAGVRFPVVDRAAKTIRMYAPAEQVLVTISVADEYLALPEDTWKAGDEVRYYYKDPGQALRVMNVTVTDVAKSGKS